MRLRVFLILFILTPMFAFAQAVSIGDILCTDGSIVCAVDFPTSGRTAWGIVFYVDDTDLHGWAVALHNQSSSIKWSSSEYYGYNIPTLVNYANARSAMHNLDGSQNTGIIRNAGSSTHFPAAWAVDYDNGWYLPSAAQLRYMYSYYPEINASLQVVGGSQFPLEGNYYWWSSTECSSYHAYDMNAGGSIGDYVKDNHTNYPPNGIAVRQIIDFNIPNPVPATYHIGDLITNDDGSQGILFYVSPDQTEGWMVALDDDTTSVSWGNGDVPSLTNQTCPSPFGLLLNETDGFANTGIIRDSQNGMNTAANAVDYQHGWYLPTAGQLSKLFGALPFIEDALQTHGHSLEYAEYWSSSEANADEAFAVSFRPANNVRAGGFIRSDKGQNYHVRAVRNLLLAPIPTVGEIETPASICENGVLTLQTPETQFATSEGWQLSPTIDFDHPTPYHGEPLDSSYDGWFIRYFVTNDYGTDYSNIVSITVLPFPEAIPEIVGPQEVYVSTNTVLGLYDYSVDSVQFATHYEWVLEGANWPMDTIGTHCTLMATTPVTATLKATAWNGCGYTEQQIVIHAGFFDVNENQALPVAVYPNPARDKVFIETEGIVRVRLYDILGQCLIEKEGRNNDKLEININNLIPAIYTIEILAEQGRIIRKLDVTH